MIDHVAEPPTSLDDAMHVVCHDWKELTAQLGLTRWVGIHLIQYSHPHTIAYRVREYYNPMPFLPDLDWFIDVAGDYDPHIAREQFGQVIELYKTDTLLHKVRKLFLASPQHIFCSNPSIQEWVEGRIGCKVNTGTVSKAKRHARIMYNLDGDGRAYRKGRPELVAMNEPHWRLQCAVIN